MNVIEEIVNNGKSEELDKIVSFYENLVSNRKENEENVKKG